MTTKAPASDFCNIRFASEIAFQDAKKKAHYGHRYWVWFRGEDGLGRGCYATTESLKWLLENFIDDDHSATGIDDTGTPWKLHRGMAEAWHGNAALGLLNS